MALADQALTSGSPEEMLKKITAHVAEGIKERFNRVLEARKHADETIEAGREFVEAYVQYMHYVEGIHSAVTAAGAHVGETAGSQTPHQGR